MITLHSTRENLKNPMYRPGVEVYSVTSLLKTLPGIVSSFHSEYLNFHLKKEKLFLKIVIGTH